VAFAAFDPASTVHRANAAALHDRLVEIGFGQNSAAALFGVTKMTAVAPRRVAFYDRFVLASDAAGRAARFFVLHLPQTDRELRAWLGDDLVGFLAEMAAIVVRDGRWISIVSISWVWRRMIVADARAYNAIWPGDPPNDYVMPPGYDTHGLVRVAPRTPRRRTLDLCCGSGVQALVAASYSDEVVGVDLNPRALRFARFNAALNRIDHATFIAGDTYAPVDGERFDAILANPPFVPWPDDDAGLLFRGGGARGDDVLERILAGVPAHLATPGSVAIVADFSDVADLPARLAVWQGAELRTLLMLERHHALLEYAETHAAHLTGDERHAAVVRLLRHYETSGIQTIATGYLLQDGAPGHTHVMRTANSRRRTVASDVAAWFEHQRRFARGGIDRTVIVLAPGLELVRERRRRDDGTIVESHAVEPGPRSMLAATTVSPFAFALLERVADGTVLPGEMTDPAEVHELGRLLDEGYVRIRAEASAVG
jgi:carbamoyltransferase